MQELTSKSTTSFCLGTDASTMAGALHPRAYCALICQGMVYSASDKNFLSARRLGIKGGGGVKSKGTRFVIEKEN